MPNTTLPVTSLARRVTQAPISPSFDRLFAELDRCRGLPSLVDLERCLGEADLDLADVLPHTASDRAGYVRTQIRLTPRYEALVMCWLPGQCSPVHDHGMSACAVKVIQGAATETVYTLGPDGLADPVTERVFRAGDVVVAADADVHSLGNLPVRGERHHWPVALVTLHVYAPQLTGSRKYLERVPAAAAFA